MLLNLLLNLLFVSSLHSHLAGDETTTTTTQAPTIPPELIKEYLTPLGPGVKEECLAASNEYLALLNDPLTILSSADRWVYKMQDASAKYPRLGLLEGHQHFPGNFQSCLEIKTENNITGDGKHCTMIAALTGLEARDGKLLTQEELKGKEQEIRRAIRDHHSRAIFALQVISNGFVVMGRCVPSICDKDDVQAGWNNFFSDTQLESLLTPYVLNCHTEDEEISLDSTDYGMIAVLAIFGTLIAIGTIADGILNIMKLDIVPERFLQVFQGFSAYSNTLKLFNTENRNPDALSCINGIRVISLTWVVMGHTYSNFGPFGHALINNANIFRAEWIKDDAFAAVINAFPSVDTFFIIGATLLTFLTLKELDKLANKGAGVTESAFFWFKYYVHRYIRLTGVYAVILFFHASLIKLFATGPQSEWMMMHHESCQADWWKNLLYINNFSFSGSGCMGQTWYLAVEMQCFIITPLLIWPLWKFPKFGLGLISMFFLAVTGGAIGIAWDKDYPPSAMFQAPDDGYMENYYVVPWVRIQPYLMGMVLGFILFKLRKTEKLKMHSIAVTWCWAIAFAVGCAVIYGTNPWLKNASDVLYDYHTIPIAARSLYNGLHRVGWGLAVGWVILACVKGAGGPVNTFLSWRAWAPLARMSYVMYLVHLPVIDYYLTLPSYTVTVNHPMVVYYLLWVLSVSALIAYICVIGFEMPLTHMEKMLFGNLPQVKRMFPQEAKTVNDEKASEKRTES